ncbi:MAG TPA: SGNH/GDSL hydrolase family protein [Aquabacterium sp.]|nr:SGNH/GDSL hydrolase family protein [Aquabacterium sp.]
MKLTKQGKRLVVWAVSALCVSFTSTAAMAGTYSSIVSFGDSLSDVGTYRVSTIAAVGGGEYTVNNGGGTNWTEQLAKGLFAPAPCAAQTGLNSVIPGIPAVPVTDHPECSNYAQGGSRVTNPVGPGNLYTYPADPGGALGQLTDPVVNQVNRYLSSHGGQFSGGELVTVLAGGNDVFMNLATVAATAAATGNDPTAVATASANAVAAMGQAGADLASLIKNQMVAKGARYVVALTLPDVSQTPFALSKDAATRTLISTMVTTFNSQLTAGLSGVNRVLIADAYSQGRLQNAYPQLFGLSNTANMACDLSKTILPTSLVCTSNTLIAGDTSRYEYADSVHPTPYAHKLLAGFVYLKLFARGWLFPAN